MSGLLGFGTGIVLFSFFPTSWYSVAFCLVVAGAFFLLWLIRKSHTYFVVGVFVCLMSFGMVRMWLVPKEIPHPFESLYDTHIQTVGVVIAPPDIRETNQRVTVEIEKEKEITRVLAVAPLYPEIKYGEQVFIRGILERPIPFDVSEGRVFAYDMFLVKDGIFAIMPNASIDVVASRAGGAAVLFGALSDMKVKGLQALSRALPEPHASLASGLILGGKQGLGRELLDDFIVVGLVHIVVLSGYNVMIVAEYVRRLSSTIFVRFATIVAAVTIGVFVLVAGAGAAGIRAGVMAGIALFARSTARTYDAFRALLFAGFLMLISNPLTLVYDYGFQLSFLATLGIIFGIPLIERHLLFIKSAFWREIVSTTVAAQIAVLPLLLFQNGLFSTVALPANLLVLPVVPLAMLASLIALVAGIVAPVAAPMLALPAYLLLSYIMSVVEVASALPFASFAIPAFPFAFVVIAYTMLISFVYKHKTQKHTLQKTIQQKKSPPD